MLQWGLSMIYVQQLRSSEALAASQKAMDIFSRLGDRESWARVAGNHGQYLMVKGKLAQATALVDEVARAATAFVNPDVFGEVRPSPCDLRRTGESSEVRVRDPGGHATPRNRDPMRTSHR
jgi:hypothetical protein